MAKKAQNNSKPWKVLTSAHEDKWVALTPDHKKVVAFSNKLDVLMKVVKGKKVVYTRGMKRDGVYAFGRHTWAG